MSVLEELKKKISDIETQSLAMEGCRPTFTVSEIMDLIDSVESDKQTAESAQNVLNSELISKKAAIDAINTWDKFGVDERGRLVRWHEGLEPYVHLRDVLTAIVNLPPAQPERPNGKWVDDGDPLTLICDQCGYRVARYNNTNFCPNCGADMKGE